MEDQYRVYKIPVDTAIGFRLTYIPAERWSNAEYASKCEILFTGTFAECRNYGDTYLTNFTRQIWENSVNSIYRVYKFPIDNEIGFYLKYIHRSGWEIMDDDPTCEKLFAGTFEKCQTFIKTYYVTHLPPPVDATIKENERSEK